MALSKPVKSVILAEKPPGIWRMSDQARGAAMPATKTEIFPYIFYHDVPAALEWLTRAFGFKEEMRTTPPDGGMHAEMSLGDQRIMMGESATATMGVFVYLDDVDGHHARARAAGAEIVNAPHDEPWGRTYSARDLDGHPWFFTTPPR